MGKKESWFSAIKRAFTPNSKQKIIDTPEKKNGKKKKWGLRKLRSHGEAASFIYREPSSIEKILGDAEKEQQKERVLGDPERVEHKVQQPVASDQKRTPSFPARDVVTHYKNAANQQRTPSIPARAVVTHYNNTDAPTSKNYHNAAIKIQAVYRGYMARRTFRALKGLVRLQGVMRGQGVKRQTMNALKHMQLLVKVQSQIQSRRSHMLENQTLQLQNVRKYDNEIDSTLGRWAFLQTSEIGQEENWDDSVLTKEERDERMQKKVEGIIKRERALAYANSKQWSNDTVKASQSALTDIRSKGLPRWWTWIERQLPDHSTSQATLQSPTLDLAVVPAQSSNLSFTPRSSKSPLPVTARTQISSPIPSLSPMKHAKLRTNRFAFNTPLRDDESLTSCPPFSVPNYMVPTVSAKAKAKTRAYNSNPREKSTVTTPTSTGKRRLSFPLTQSIGSLRWGKFSYKDSPTSSERITGKYKSTQSISNFSVDSTTSLPVGVGRKPFNRFV
ncbi:hypothetical protein GIB67_024080 [Kingdonia uniflora]|uniref:DUF4005 domain-containing protein n=1 Tax=Kingdonia uniflora TaxID=39325 RepID=A0A7J7MMU0_9MAGN|nr:hypothetical protein GIB67_024080 [Kingdonia uniflora]